MTKISLDMTEKKEKTGSRSKKKLTSQVIAVVKRSTR